MTTDYTAHEVEVIIQSNIFDILERAKVYGRTPETVANIRNPYDLANILPEILYDYCLECDVEYWAVWVAEEVRMATEEDEDI